MCDCWLCIIAYMLLLLLFDLNVSPVGYSEQRHRQTELERERETCLCEAMHLFSELNKLLFSIGHSQIRFFRDESLWIFSDFSHTYFYELIRNRRINSYEKIVNFFIWIDVSLDEWIHMKTLWNWPNYFLYVLVRDFVKCTQKIVRYSRMSNFCRSKYGTPLIFPLRFCQNNQTKSIQTQYSMILCSHYMESNSFKNKETQLF